MQEEIKESTTYKKKKKKIVKNVFIVEDLSNNNDVLRIGKENNSKQLKNKNKTITNVINGEKQLNLNNTENKIIKYIKKNEKQKIDHIQHNNNVKKMKKQKIDHTQNNNKNISNNEKQITNHTQDKNKIIKNIKKSKKQKMDNTLKIKNLKKRKMDYAQNGSNKKQKFMEKNYKSNKETNALESITDDRLKAYGINPKKFRNKLKFGSK